jgi:GNAT superfamily N-acetyltransferase
MKSESPYLIRLSTDSDVAAVRLLVNQAYKELADMGLNYTATFQDEEKTRQRMNRGRCFLLLDGERIIGTISIHDEDYLKRSKKCAYVAQFGIHPDYKRKKLGSLLMDHVEKLAVDDGYASIQLDTAKPATHLVAWYLKRGYQIIADYKWAGKTYESWIFEKELNQ